MDRLIDDLNAVTAAAFLPIRHKALIRQLIDVLKGIDADGNLRNSVQLFLHHLDAAPLESLKYFRPRSSPEIVGTWRLLWKAAEPRIGQVVMDSVIVQILLQLCLRRSGHSSITYEKYDSTKAYHPLPVLTPYPEVSNGRYDDQAAFTMMKAREWMKSNDCELRAEAERILDCLAPTVSQSVDSTNATFRYDVTDDAVAVVRLLYTRARSHFRPETYGDHAIVSMIGLLLNDDPLLTEFRQSVQRCVGVECDRNVAEYLLKAMVTGSRNSISKNLFLAMELAEDDTEREMPVRTSLKAAGVSKVKDLN